ncbi:MAG: MazF family transcriptional regulator [Desulfobacteraceae bacterium IS3]|nr:MAG: MazF family transcriptional regulator [Desulfobacteraceae bacterium IS3]
MTVKQGEIYLACLDPVVGAEMSKSRPVLVVSNNLNNEFSGTVTILPITSSTGKIYPFEVLLRKGTGNLPKDSKAKADQIRTLDKSRLTQRIGALSSADIVEIQKAIKIHLDL